MINFKIKWICIIRVKISHDFSVYILPSDFKEQNFNIYRHLYANQNRRQF